MENEIYHKQQIEHIYRSTEVFIDWLEKYKFIEREKELNVLDMACGCGANTMYMANRFKDSQFIGMDINEDFINYDGIKVFINGRYVEFSESTGYPFVLDGSTMIPLRAVSEAFGAKVDWNEYSKTASVSKYDTSVDVTVDSKEMKVKDLNDKIFNSLKKEIEEDIRRWKDFPCL